MKALAKLQALRDMESLPDYVDEGPVGKRRLPVITVEEDEEEEDDLLTEADDAEPAPVRAIGSKSAPRVAPQPIIEESLDFDGVD